jgi:aminopeptidase N
MRNRLLFGVLSVAMLACSGSKKSQSSNSKQNAGIKAEEPAVLLDTIRVVASEEPKKKIYRESNPLMVDIIHTSLKVSFDWANSQLNGTAVITASPYFYPTSIMYLNARGMNIKKIAVSLPHTVYKTQTSKGKKYDVMEVDYNEGYKDVKYIYEHDSIKIDLGRELKSNENFYVQVDYVAKPNELKKGGSAAINDDKGLYFINPKGEDPNKMPQIWTQGETQSNSAWFPTVDSPNEKMTSEIFMR